MAGLEVCRDRGIGWATTGVGAGVDWLEDGAEGRLPTLAEGTTICWKICPSSPGAKVTAEQKPSEELMMRVRPSVDHDKSVNVA